MEPKASRNRTPTVEARETYPYRLKEAKTTLAYKGQWCIAAPPQQRHGRKLIPRNGLVHLCRCGRFGAEAN